MQFSLEVASVRTFTTLRFFITLRAITKSNNMQTSKQWHSTGPEPVCGKLRHLPQPFCCDSRVVVSCSHHEHSKHLRRQFNHAHCFSHNFFAYEPCLVTITSWAAVIDCSCNRSISNHRLRFYLMYYHTCSVPSETSSSSREIFQGNFIFLGELFFADRGEKTKKITKLRKPQKTFEPHGLVFPFTIIFICNIPSMDLQRCCLESFSLITPWRRKAVPSEILENISLYRIISLANVRLLFNL